MASSSARERMKRLTDSLARASERNYLLYALATTLRQWIRGRDPAPHRGDFPGRAAYLEDYVRWQPLRTRLLVRDEARLQRLVLANAGHTVGYGPFRGMTFRTCVDHWSAASMLGFYEAELHPHVEAAVAHGYRRVVNVGCASGYYAVGLARRLPDATIHAFDRSQPARDACAALARENAVEEQVRLGGEFSGPEFEELIGDATLVVCDIEGGELEVLDPARFPALRRADVIVELHDALIPGVSAEVVARFEATHEVELVREDEHPPLPLPDWLASLGGVERYIATHGGGRWGPTPWAVMRVRP